MIQSTQQFNAASLDVMNGINFASMHTFLLSVSNQSNPEMFRCSALSNDQVLVVSLADGADGIKMSLREFSEFLQDKPEPNVAFASTPGTKVLFSALIHKIKLDGVVPKSIHDTEILTHTVKPEVTQVSTSSMRRR